MPDIRDHILETMLPDVPFDGWSWALAQKAAVKAGYDAAMAQAVFPGKVADILDHFSDWADRQMLKKLKRIRPDSLRVRDRVQTAVLERLQALSPYKDQVRLSTRYWTLPYRAPRAAKIVWRTADRIWDWAGDTAKDYNRYTKRALLAGVLSSTMLAWLADAEPGFEGTKNFLGRRIDQVVRMGQTLGKFKKAV